MPAEWSGPETDYPRDCTLSELFAQQAARSADAVAVVHGPVALSYGELDRRAARLARALRARGVGPDVLVGVCLPRSVDLVIALLAIMKAGGAYLPLDPAHPAERLAFMLRDAAAPIVLADPARRSLLPAAVATLSVDDSSTAPGAFEPGEATCSAEAGAENLAYVIYTSGSTGVPKGVAVPHRAIARLVCHTDYLQLGPDEVVAQASNTAFDAATWEIWGALLHGARLVIVPREVVLSPVDLAGFLVDHGITALFVTTALFNQCARELPSAFRTLRHLLFGGEAVDPRCVADILRHGPPGRLLHVYGPTESTTYATWHLVRSVAPGAATVPIGLPLANTACVVLDPERRPVRPGVPGELYIGGDGLARGYLHRADLTAERFVPSPFGPPGARLYRTGDRVRPGADGAIEFLGRFDDQTKIRGFRIEPGEIQTALDHHPGVRASVVVALEDPRAERRLVAYVVPAAPRPSPAVLRHFLRLRVPDFMVPSAFVFLDTLPINANGKIDRAALPAPDWGNATDDRPFRPPTSETERCLAAIWSEVLRVRRVGADDNFVHLGGHSLTAAQMFARVREAMGVELPLRAVLDAATLADLGGLIDRARRDGEHAAETPIRCVPRSGPLRLSPSQERVWFLHQLAPESLAYNFQAAIRLRGPLDVGALEKSLGEVVRRHEIFRTTFAVEGGRPVQAIQGDVTVRLPVLLVDDLPPGERETRVRELIAERVTVPFDLSRLPLVRWTLIRIAETEHVLVHIEHHIVHDGWSYNVFLRELLALYGAATGRGAPPPAPEVQFADFAAWQHEWMQGPAAHAQLAYWRAQLTAPPPPLALPADRARLPVPTFRGGAPRQELPGLLAAELSALARREGVTFYMVVLAGFAALLHRYTGATDVCVGTGFANRRRRDTEGVIGMVINNVVLRLDLDGNPTVRELLARVRETTLEASAHQDIPFDRVVESVAPRRDLSYNPLFQVMFGLHDAPMPEPSVPELTVEDLMVVPNGSAKFDLTLIAARHSQQRIGPPAPEREDGLTVVWEYSADLFEEATVRRMMGHYQTMLEALVADPNRHLADMPFIDEAADTPRTASPWSAAPRADDPQDRRSLPPASPTERRVAAIWKELLGVGEVGRHDSFFDLGGHSLLATRLMARLSEATGVAVPLRAIFEGPTVAELAVLVDAGRAQAGAPDGPRPITRASREAFRVPPSPPAAG